MLGKEDTPALPNAGEQNPWHPFASTSCSLCSGLPRCFKFSHSPSHHCVSPAATLLSSSSFPTITLRNHGCWESPEPQPHTKTVCITHVTQTLIHSCPGTAVIQTKWSCQKKISLCQVWQLYVSWEHVVVTGTHTADNATNFSSFARHWDKVCKLCRKEFPVPPWWIRSIREGRRGARKCVVPPVCNHLRKPFSMRAQWDWAQEMDLCIYPTPQSTGDHFSSEQTLPCNPDCHAEETPLRSLRVEANITQPQVLPFPLKPKAEGLGSQQIWSSFYNPTPACILLLFKHIDVKGLLIYHIFLLFFVWSQALCGQGRMTCAAHIMFRPQHESSTLTANKRTRNRICPLVTLRATATANINLQSSTSFNFIYDKKK